MPADGEYEPADSRKVVGTKGDPKKSWREQEPLSEGSGEYEPLDSRNVTGQASTGSDRWSNEQKRPPLANGETPAEPDDGESADRG